MPVGAGGPLPNADRAVQLKILTLFEGSTPMLSPVLRFWEMRVIGFRRVFGDLQGLVSGWVPFGWG